ncbi:MAG: chromosomal replication initiator protein DnaA, partial [Phycisphaerae bacterium]
MSRLSETTWADILGYVRTHYPGLSRSWFSQLSAGDLEQGELSIVAANGSQLTYLQAHCIRPFLEAAQAATGHLVTVSFQNGQDPDPQAILPSAELEKSTAFEQETSLLRLNGDYVFDNFVTGPCNRLAHAACVAVSEAPGSAYNPVFIHGNVGLGKTHLLQAVCQRVLDHAPATRILYLTCETFVNHFIDAVERGELRGFRYRYRHVDMLMIDDVQFLSGRDRTQEEFFHTFNTLYQVNKQIIVTADCPPPEIPSLEERLVSRFNWGLVARVDSPCLETRCAIISKKMKLRDLDLPEDVVMLIASRIESNTRELEGAINRIHGLAILTKRPIDCNLAREALGETADPPSRQIRIHDITNI